MALAVLAFSGTAAMALGNDAAQPVNAPAFLPQRQEAPKGFQVAQATGADLAVRLQQLEGQMRSLNGRIEQLEFQNKRLQEQLQRFQGDVDFRFQDLQGGKGGAKPPAQRRTEAPPSAPPR